MLKNIKPEEFWRIFKTLPQDIKETLFSTELPENVYQICKRYKIEEKFEEIMEDIGEVLTGFLNPEDFEKLIFQKLELDEKEKRLFLHEIYRIVFFPVKESLNEIYTLGAPKFKKEGLPPKEKVDFEKEKKEVYKFLEEKPSIPPKKQTDIYREPIE